jgi:uncharacterized protein (DUF934 family)
MPLIKDGKLADDPWVSAVGADSIPETGAVIVSLEQWRDQRDALIARGGAVGVQLASDQAPEAIADDLTHLELVALEFPAFTDGRAYSYARLLRERLGFEGELRAVGDVLIEQLLFMHRSGFDAFEVESEHAVADWETALGDIHVFYQPTGDGRQTAMEQRKR